MWPSVLRINVLSLTYQSVHQLVNHSCRCTLPTSLWSFSDQLARVEANKRMGSEKDVLLTQLPHFPHLIIFLNLVCAHPTPGSNPMNAPTKKNEKDRRGFRSSIAAAGHAGIMNRLVERKELSEQQTKRCSPDRTRDNPRQRHFTVNHRLTLFAWGFIPGRRGREIRRTFPQYIANRISITKKSNSRFLQDLLC